MPAPVDIERPPTLLPPDTHSQHHRWYDLGLTFTPKTALTLLALLAVGVAFSFAFDFVISRFVQLDEARIVGWIEGFGALGPIIYILLLAATIIFTPLPSVVVIGAGGLAFGTGLGVVYTIAGGMIGATINFFIARRLGRGFVERRLGDRAMAQIDMYADRMGATLVFLTRLIPLFNFDWVSYAAGLTRMKYQSYAIASVLGMLLPVIGMVYVGDVKLSHPGRSSLVFTLLVIWSALPPLAFLIWAGVRALDRRLRRERATGV
ncbi:MAG: TVP38/TMEM64 family protein [Dehalococcoidia bacterium]